MNCPECNYNASRVHDTARVEGGLRRYRSCKKCGARFATMERIELYDHTLMAYVSPEDAPRPLSVVPPAPKASQQVAAARKADNRRWHPADTVPDGVCEEAAPLLLEWWNESRRSKHKGNATWTEAAWLATCNRIAQLPQWQQVALCAAGVEHGWQTLKPEYLKEELAKPTALGRPMPQDPRMLAALEQWPSQSA